MVSKAVGKNRKGRGNGADDKARISKVGGNISRNPKSNRTSVGAQNRVVTIRRRGGFKEVDPKSRGYHPKIHEWEIKRIIDELIVLASDYPHLDNPIAARKRKSKYMRIFLVEWFYWVGATWEPERNLKKRAQKLIDAWRKSGHKEKKFPKEGELEPQSGVKIEPNDLHVPDLNYNQAHERLEVSSEGHEGNRGRVRGRGRGRSTILGRDSNDNRAAHIRAIRERAGLRRSARLRRKEPDQAVVVPGEVVAITENNDYDGGDESRGEEGGRAVSPPPVSVLLQQEEARKEEEEVKEPAGSNNRCRITNTTTNNHTIETSTTAKSTDSTTRNNITNDDNNSSPASTSDHLSKLQAEQDKIFYAKNAWALVNLQPLSPFLRKKLMTEAKFFLQKVVSDILKTVFRKIEEQENLSLDGRTLLSNMTSQAPLTNLAITIEEQVNFFAQKQPLDVEVIYQQLNARRPNYSVIISSRNGADSWANEKRLLSETDMQKRVTTFYQVSESQLFNLKFGSIGYAVRISRQLILQEAVWQWNFRVFSSSQESASIPFSEIPEPAIKLFLSREFIEYHKTSEGEVPPFESDLSITTLENHQSNNKGNCCRIQAAEEQVLAISFGKPNKNNRPKRVQKRPTKSRAASVVCQGQVKYLVSLRSTNGKNLEVFRIDSFDEEEHLTANSSRNKNSLVGKNASGKNSTSSKFKISPSSQLISRSSSQYTKSNSSAKANNSNAAATSVISSTYDFSLGNGSNINSSANVAETLAPFSPSAYNLIENVENGEENARLHAEMLRHNRDRITARSIFDQLFNPPKIANIWYLLIDLVKYYGSQLTITLSEVDDVEEDSRSVPPSFIIVISSYEISDNDDCHGRFCSFFFDDLVDKDSSVQWFHNHQLCMVRFTRELLNRHELWNQKFGQEIEGRNYPDANLRFQLPKLELVDSPFQNVYLTPHCLQIFFGPYGFSEKNDVELIVESPPDTTVFCFTPSGYVDDGKAKLWELASYYVNTKQEEEKDTADDDDDDNDDLLQKRRKVACDATPFLPLSDAPENDNTGTRQSERLTRDNYYQRLFPSLFEKVCFERQVLKETEQECPNLKRWLNGPTTQEMITSLLNAFFRNTSAGEGLRRLLTATNGISLDVTFAETRSKNDNRNSNSNRRWLKGDNDLSYYMHKIVNLYPLTVMTPFYAKVDLKNDTFWENSQRSAATSADRQNEDYIEVDPSLVKSFINCPTKEKAAIRFRISRALVEKEAVRCRQSRLNRDKLRRQPRFQKLSTDFGAEKAKQLFKAEERDRDLKNKFSDKRWNFRIAKNPKFKLNLLDKLFESHKLLLLSKCAYKKGLQMSGFANGSKSDDSDEDSDHLCLEENTGRC